MTPGEWIALMSLFVVILLAVVTGAVYTVREQGKLRALILQVVKSHENGCLNYERHTSPNIKAVVP